MLLLLLLQVIKHIQTFKFEPEHIEFIKSILPAAEPAFFGAHHHHRWCCGSH